MAAGAGTVGAGRANPAPALPKHRPLALSSSFVFIIAVLIQLIGFIGSLSLYRQVGFNDTGKALLGVIQLYLIIGSSINTVGDLRLGSAFTFFLARGKPATEGMGTYLVLRFAMVAVVSFVLFVLAPLSVFGHTLAVGRVELTVLGAFLVMPLLWSISTVYNQLWVGQGDSIRAQLPLLVESLVRTPVLIFVAYHDPTLTGITYAYLAGAVASTLFALPAVVRRTRRASRREARLMFRYAWPLMGSLILAYLAANLMPFIVAAALGSVALNVFLVANGFRILALSLPVAISVPLFPYLATRHRVEDYPRVRSGTWQALRYTAMLVVPGVLALVIFRVNFLNVLTNRSYALAAATPLALLAISAIPLALSQIIGTALNAIGRQRLELYLTSLQVAVLFGVSYLLLPPVALFPSATGDIGASVAVLLSGIASLALNAYFLHTLMAVRLQPRSIGGIVLSALVSFLAVAYLINDLANSSAHIFARGYYHLAAGVLVGFAVYFLVLALVGELSREDVEQIGASIGLPSGIGRAVGRLCWRRTSPVVNAADLEHAPGLRPLELPETFSGETEIPSLLDSAGAPGAPEEQTGR